MDIKELPLKKPKQKRRHAQSEAQKAQQAKFLKRGYHGQQVEKAEATRRSCCPHPRQR